MTKPQPDAPAIIREGHTQSRVLSTSDRDAKGWRAEDVSPIGLAKARGQLEDPAGKGPRDNPITGEMRYLAMRDYVQLYETAEIRTGRDSSDMDIVSGGGGFPITQARADATKKIVSIKSHLLLADRTIIQKLAEGWSLAGAVREAEGERYVHAVMVRVRTALDGLIEAQERAKRSGWKFERVR